MYGLYDYKHLLPNKSVIDVMDFESVKHLAQYLKLLSEDKYKYNSYMEWKSSHCVNSRRFEDKWGLLCDKLIDELNGQTIFNQTNKQMKYISDYEHCINYNFTEY